MYVGILLLCSIFIGAIGGFIEGWKMAEGSNFIVRFIYACLVGLVIAFASFLLSTIFIKVVSFLY